MTGNDVLLQYCRIHNIKSVYSKHNKLHYLCVDYFKDGIVGKHNHESKYVTFKKTTTIKKSDLMQCILDGISIH